LEAETNVLEEYFFLLPKKLETTGFSETSESMMPPIYTRRRENNHEFIAQKKRNRIDEMGQNP
jgi:hypothetical protein